MDAVLKQVGKKFERKTPDQLTRPSREEAEAAVRTLIAWTGDDPEREGLQDTPKRVVKAYEQLYAGYFEDPFSHLERVFEDVGGYQDIVMVRNIPFNSFCEHHMLPFIGEAHIAYYPAEGVVGLSKLARVVDIFAKRLQTQEHLTSQIASAIDDAIAPRGIAVMLEAEHQCMTMRGVQKQGVSTITTQFTGVFQDEPVTAPAFLTRGIPVTTSIFAERGDKTEIETGAVLQPKFDADGLIAAVVTDHASGDVLMVGYMNAEALRRTIETGEAWYWSRSRQAYWKKGETSGQIQHVKEIRTDCDQDAIWLKVEVAGNGATCHTGFNSCFFRKIVQDTNGDFRLERVEKERVYDPKDVYGA